MGKIVCLNIPQQHKGYYYYNLICTVLNNETTILKEELFLNKIRGYKKQHATIYKKKKKSNDPTEINQGAFH